MHIHSRFIANQSPTAPETVFGGSDTAEVYTSPYLGFFGFGTTVTRKSKSVLDFYLGTIITKSDSFMKDVQGAFHRFEARGPRLVADVNCRRKEIRPQEAWHWHALVAFRLQMIEQQNAKVLDHEIS